MTVFCILFADVTNGEEPIVISDVLVTSEMLGNNTERYQKIYLPSIGGTFPHLTGVSSIKGYIQKTYIVGRRTFVAAGTLNAAHGFYDEMHSAETFEKFWSACSQYKDDLQFASFALESSTSQIYLCCTDSCRQMQLGDYGYVIVGGSGESTIRNLLLKHQSLGFDGDKAMAPIARALCLVSEAIDLDDTAPSQSLQRLFGGYYEISYFSHDAFFKLERVLFSFWEVVIQDNGPQWMPTKMFFHEYVDGVLVVRRITISSESGESAVIWQDCYGIGGFSASSSNELVRSKVSTSIPEAIMEVASVELNGACFRFVSLDKPIIRFEAAGDRWVTKIDYQLLQHYSASIADAIERTRPS